MARGEVQQFLFDTANVPQAQHGTATDRAALSFHRASGTRCQRHDKAAAVVPQGVDRLLHAARSHGLEPGAERKHAFRDAAGRGDPGVAKNFRLLGGSGPGHQDLWVGQQQRLEAIGFRLQRDNLIPRTGFEPLGSPAGADECHACEQAKGQQRKEEREKRDFLAAKCGYRAVNCVNRGPAEAPLCVRRRTGQG
jgi:hypothetical protein